ncbi:MAG: TVP38/TMEM64 family protein [Candidatus Korobacteraceae bacterium]
MAVLLRELPLQDHTLRALDWIRDAGLRGALLYSALYIAATVLFVPPAFLNTAAGFLWGAAMGIAVVYPSNVLAAVVAFFLGRFLARRQVARWLGRNRYLAALDAAIHRSGAKFVFLLRLSPFLPFASLNYMLGLSSIRGRDYVLASFGTLPGTFLCVSLGALLEQAAEIFMGAPQAASYWHHAFLWTGVVGGLAAVALLTRNVYLELRRAVAGPPVASAAASTFQS